MNDTKALGYTASNLKKVESMHSRDCWKGRSYVCHALLMHRAAKNGGAKGLLAFWNARKRAVV